MRSHLSSIQHLIIDLHFVDLILVLTWLLLLKYCQGRSSYDPTSIFFRWDDAYAPIYSTVREKEADKLINFLQSPDLSTDTNEAQKLQATEWKSHDRAAKYCVGIPSLQREKSQFLSRTVASLVDSLKPDERDLLHIVVLLSDDNAVKNSAFGSKWLNTIADEVLVHEDTASSLVHENHYRKIPRLSPMADRDERVRRDYAALSETCRRQGIEYFILVEDDVIAARDWFDRLRNAIPQVKDRAYTNNHDWLYIRLFYSETYLGWNSEEWPMYITNIAFIYIASLSIIVAVRQSYQRLPTIVKKHVLKNSRLLHVRLLLIWLPLFIGLGFMAGRLTVAPFSLGIREMPQYGCCSQGLVIPRRHLEILEKRLLTPPFDLAADSTIEKTADDLRMSKWALVPSVLQHIGARGSSAKGGARKSTWNFNFERLHSK